MSSRLIYLVGVGLLALNLGSGSLLSSDDVLYVQMAREMVASGDWIQPTWMGELVFEKPPLLLWLLSLCGSVFGWGEWSMRLPGALGGLLTLWCVVQLTREGLQDDDVAPSPWSAALPLTLCLAAVIFVFNVRRPITDPLLMAFAVMSLWACAGVLSSGSRAVPLGIAMGLGVLSKSVAMGPVGLVVIVALLFARRFSALVRSLAVAATIAIPWHLWMLVTHGRDFWDSYVGYHIVGRAGGALVGETGFWTYVELAAQEDPVISLVLITGLVAGSVVAFRSVYGGARRQILALCAAAAWLTLVVVHLASTRLFHYLLPVVPMVAVVTSICVLCSGHRRILSWGVSLVCLLAFVSGPLDHLTNPDYSPSARTVAERHLLGLPPEQTIVLWESYDPALFWYAQRAGEIWSEDEGFYEAQQSVDMMRRSGTVIRADQQRFRALTDEGDVVVVVPEHRRHTFDSWF
ncbi:MAG: glycosyltransferase family 39 protein, partial [Myxococcota bacterium]|nr:glycosyltransferase family 39 protein [Myxococcota bacterium]